jgi:arginase family enzyme
MKEYGKQFLGLEKDQQAHYNAAPVIVAPFPYEGGISYGRGAARGPESIINAYYLLEL